MSWLLTGLALVFVIEGLALALAPSRIEEALDFLRGLSADQRRTLGLAAVAGGVAILWLLRIFA